MFYLPSFDVNGRLAVTDTSAPFSKAIFKDDWIQADGKQDGDTIDVRPDHCLPYFKTDNENGIQKFKLLTKNIVILPV